VLQFGIIKLCLNAVYARYKHEDLVIYIRVVDRN